MSRDTVHRCLGTRALSPLETTLLLTVDETLAALRKAHQVDTDAGDLASSAVTVAVRAMCVCSESPLGHSCDVAGHRSQVSRDIVHVRACGW
jgi:hypothetical protein